jgi:hypothetical protein
MKLEKERKRKTGRGYRGYPRDKAGHVFFVKAADQTIQTAFRSLRESRPPEKKKYIINSGERERLQNIEWPK